MKPVWPACVVCGQHHRPASFGNGGPPRCWHCGLIERRCRCGPGFPVWLLYGWLAWFACMATLVALMYWLGAMRGTET